MRPAYHFTPKANWLSDPNGLVHDGNDWHMFYQYNPRGEDWGNMSWGHAVSENLARWEERAPALLADEHRHVYSGSAAMDRSGSAGFGKHAMIALYTAASASEPQHQAQALAYSRDAGESWSEYEGNPVLDLEMADFRDPYVFWHEPSAAWIMVVVKSNEQLAQVYRSHDLKDWSLASEIAAGSAPGEIWECPTFVELPICGSGKTRWVFKVDVLKGAPGSGALYLIGDFDGHSFSSDSGEWKLIDHGRDFYAAIAWNGPRDDAGRPVWIGWMGNHAYQHDFPKRGWRGVMSAPRRMGLVERTGDLSLSQAIEPSIARLFGDFGPLTGKHLPLASRVEISRDFSGAMTLSDGIASTFTICADGNQWRAERRDTALPFLDTDIVMDRHETERLSLWIDSETIEMLNADGTCCASFQHRPGADHLLIETDQPAKVSVATLV